MVSKTSPFLNANIHSLYIYRCGFLGLALGSVLLMVFNYSSFNVNAVNVLDSFERTDVTGYRAASQFEKQDEGGFTLTCGIAEPKNNEFCGLEFGFPDSGLPRRYPSFDNLEQIEAAIQVTRNGEAVSNRLSLTFRSVRPGRRFSQDDLSTTRFESVHFMPGEVQVIDRKHIFLDSWWDKQFQSPLELAASDLTQVVSVSVYIESSDRLLPGKYVFQIDRLLLNQYIIAPGVINLLLALVWPAAMLFFLFHYLFIKRSELQRMSALTDTDAETGLMNLNGLRRRYPGKLSQPVTLINVRVRNFLSLQREFSRETVTSLIKETFLPFTQGPRVNVLLVKKQDEDLLLLTGHCDEAFFGKLISAAQQGIHMDSMGHLRLDVKVGIARGEKGMTLEELMAQTTIAIDAISDGEASYKIYHPELRKAYRQERFVEQELRIALKQNALQLAFMPVYDAVTQKICGAEALLRTSHIPLKSFSPEVYVRVAEKVGLIREIDFWVLEQAIQALRDIRQNDFVMAVNVSSRELMDKRFAEQLRHLIKQYGVRANNLCLEVTETFFIDVNGICFESIQAIRNLGVQLSLDDFGTGHASLQHLLNMPIDEIKIDRSFVWSLNNEKSAVIVDAIVSIAKICQYDVVAEGIETEEQLNKLAALGCRYFQGYLIAKPDTFDKLVEICNEVERSTRLDTEVLGRVYGWR